MTHPLGALAPLAEHRQFILVMLTPKGGGKMDKLPCDYRTLLPTLKDGKGAHNPNVWTDYDTVAAIVARAPSTFAVGFVLTPNDPFFCVDIDACALPDGSGWSPVAQDICGRLQGTVIERSVSGTGLHVWGRRSAMPVHTMKNTAYRIELYSSLRFILLGSGAVGTMVEDCTAIDAVIAEYFPPRVAADTSNVPDEGPCPEWQGPTDDDELIRRMLASKSAASAFSGKASFADLWYADERMLSKAYPHDTEPFDRSSADMALASHLAFWTGKHVARVERLMRRSKLVRDKWDDRSDYLVDRTIRRACTSCREVYGQRKAAGAGVTVPTGASLANSHAGDSLTFLASAAGTIPATIENVHDALVSQESGVRLAYDNFQAHTMIGEAGKWRRFEDVDYGRLRAQFGRRGFRPVTAEIMKTAVQLAAEQSRFDSAIEWAESLQWDGRPRIDTAMSRYFGCADTPYTRAVGRYLFTALAGRALVPGCQADMALVLVGLQGARKTSAVEALCPDPEFFVEVNLKKIDDDNLSRKLRGKLVGELAELRGLAGRDQESVKAWITRRVERWRPLYQEFDATFLRRLVLIGTTNDPEFLDDSTGERRWLPVESGQVEVEAIERDRDQLWAEGVAVFKASGVAWQEAERLAKDVHARHKVIDPWTELVEGWLAKPVAIDQTALPPEGPLLLEQVALGALRRSLGSMTRPESLRLGKVMRSLGYARRQAWLNGRNLKAWLKST